MVVLLDPLASVVSCDRDTLSRAHVYRAGHWEPKARLGLRWPLPSSREPTGDPKREHREYSKTMTGVHLPGSLYNVFLLHSRTRISIDLSGSPYSDDDIPSIFLGFPYFGVPIRVPSNGAQPQKHQEAD